MRTVRHEEVEAGVNSVHEMSESDTREFMKQMMDEQPYIQVYVTAVCERGELDDENDLDAFANIASIVWHAMRKAADGKLPKVTGKAIEEQEERMTELCEYAEGELAPEWATMVASWMDGYNQRPLLEFALQALMSPENPYQVTPDGAGVIFMYVKTIIDSLDSLTLFEAS